MCANTDMYVCRYMQPLALNNMLPTPLYQILKQPLTAQVINVYNVQISNARPSVLRGLAVHSYVGLPERTVSRRLEGAVLKSFKMTRIAQSPTTTSAVFHGPRFLIHCSDTNNTPQSGSRAPYKIASEPQQKTA